MWGCGPQFMDHMRSISRGRLQILSLASEVDRLKKNSTNRHYLLVKEIQRVVHRPLWPRAHRIAGSAEAVVTPLGVANVLTLKTLPALHQLLRRLFCMQVWTSIRRDEVNA